MWSKENAMAQSIAPCLWFDTQAEEATNFYVSLFPSSRILHVDRYADIGPEPAASVVVVEFELNGRPFQAFNGGPLFPHSPAISFFVTCSSDEVDRLWASLIEGGMALMPLDAYPISEKFGWVQDRYGVNWQLSATNAPLAITPKLTFVGDNFGRVEEALGFYTSVFQDAHIDDIDRFGPGTHDPEGAIAHARFTIEGQPFMAMESSWDHAWGFTEALSLAIECADEQQVDHYWDALISGGGEPSQCGWLEDKYGVSWQVVPRRLIELLRDPDRERAGLAMRKMLQMTKLDIAELQAAFDA